jgi:transposase
VARPKPWEVSDELWAVIEPLLPKVERRSRYPGRKRLDDCLVLQGILFVLHIGISWEHLPQELGFGLGMTCWRPLAEWHEAGVCSGCTRSCSRSCGPRTRSTSPARPWTPRPSGNDVTRLVPLLEAVPPVWSKRGRPRRRLDVVLADRGYDHDK